jgi:hypothetical protein
MLCAVEGRLFFCIFVCYYGGINMPIPLILGAIAAAGAITSAVVTAKANKKRQEALEKEGERQRLFYERQLNENPLEQYHNKALLGRLQEQMKERIATARARAKITGEMDTSNVIRDQNAAALSSVYNNILSNASLRKDSLNQALERSRQNLYQQQADLDYAKQQNYANFAANIGNAAATAAGAYDGQNIGGGAAKFAPNDESTKIVDSPIKTPKNNKLWA